MPSGWPLAQVVFQPLDRVITAQHIGLLEQFAVRGINLTTIQSRPTGDRLGQALRDPGLHGRLADAGVRRVQLNLADEDAATLRRQAFARPVRAVVGVWTTGSAAAAALVLRGVADECALKAVELSSGKVTTLAETPLGLRHGLVVVTRSDLADPGATLAESRRRVADSSLAGVQAVAVSVEAFDGEGCRHRPQRRSPATAGKACAARVSRLPSSPGWHWCRRSRSCC